MSKALTVQESQVALWGDQESIRELAEKIKRVLPGGDKMSDNSALAVAQYSAVMGANPMRGEIYAWEDWRGQLIVDEGYKLLVRWAKRKCDYSEWHEPLTGDKLPKGAIGSRCFILRNDKQALLTTLLNGGMPYEQAIKIAATTAVGIVTQDDMVNKKTGRPIPPPKGWTWQQVAEKRALKNALNKSHGAPSAADVARESWLVGDTETKPEDWQAATDEMGSGPGADRLAQLHAHERAHLQDVAGDTPEQIQARRQAASRQFYGDGEGLTPTPQPEVVEGDYSEAEEVEESAPGLDWALTYQIEGKVPYGDAPLTGIEKIADNPKHTPERREPAVAINNAAKALWAEFKALEEKALSLEVVPDYPGDNVSYNALADIVDDLSLRVEQAESEIPD